MKKYSKVFLVMLLAISLVLSVGCSDKSAEAKAPENAPAEEAQKLIVGTEPTFPPFEMTDEETGEITGFDIELIKAIAADQGFEVEVQSLGFDGLIPAVQSGTIDIVASGMTITDERAKTVSFSTPYINAGLAVAVAADNETIKSADDLNGLTAAVQIGSTGSAKAEELKAAGILKEVKTFNTVDVAMMELANGGVDCVINDLPVTQAYIAKQPGVAKIAGEPLTSESYGFAVELGNQDLVDKINAGLQNLKDNGTYEELTKKYF